MQGVINMFLHINVHAFFYLTRVVCTDMCPSTLNGDFFTFKGWFVKFAWFNSVLFIKQKFRRKVTSRCFTLQSEDTKISERKHHQAAGFPSSWAAFSECGEEELPFSRKRGEGGWRDPVPGNQWSSENNARSSLMPTKVSGQGAMCWSLTKY